MSVIWTDSVPRADYRVRRRVTDGRAYLLRQNDWFALDPQVDRVWKACSRGSTVAEIAAGLAAEDGVTVGDALASTVLALALLHGAGLVGLPDERPDSVSAASLVMPEPHPRTTGRE